jgi:hypothetical protein
VLSEPERHSVRRECRRTVVGPLANVKFPTIGNGRCLPDAVADHLAARRLGRATAACRVEEATSEGVLYCDSSKNSLKNVTESGLLLSEIV